MSDNKFEVKPHIIKDTSTVVLQVIVYDNEGRRHVIGTASVNRGAIGGTLLTELPQEVADAFSNGPREVLIVPKDRFQVPYSKGNAPRCLAPMPGDKVCYRVHGHTLGHDSHVPQFVREQGE